MKRFITNCLLWCYWTVILFVTIVVLPFVFLWAATEPGTTRQRKC